VDYSLMSPEELVHACFVSGEESIWSEFVRRFHPVISRVALRVARQWGESSPDVIDDLVQETFLKLCKERGSLLRKFESHHSDAVFAYFGVITANLVRDHFRAAHAIKRGGALAAASIDLDHHGEPVSPRSEHSIDRDLLLREVEACLREATRGLQADRDRRIFWLYYRIGIPAGQIALLPGIQLTTKGVESTILRLTRLVRERLNRQAGNQRQKDIQAKGILPTDPL
jgi:RNA polymerase sigma-70 factor (ECF subfamily)